MLDYESFLQIATAPKSPVEAAIRIAATVFERRGESNLVPYEGPKGGRGKKNPATGRVYYDKGDGSSTAAIATPDVKSATQKALDSGLREWVETYKHWRKSGNVKMAEQSRDAIKDAIAKYELDSTMVWGQDPDDPAVRDAAQPGNDENSTVPDPPAAPVSKQETEDPAQSEASSTTEPHPTDDDEGLLENTALARQALGMSGREINLVNRVLTTKQRKDMRAWSAKDLSDAVDAIQKAPLKPEKKQRIEGLVFGERFRRLG